jgi:hypothetical protein
VLGSSGLPPRRLGQSQRARHTPSVGVGQSSSGLGDAARATVAALASNADAQTGVGRLRLSGAMRLAFLRRRRLQIGLGAPPADAARRRIGIVERLHVRDEQAAEVAGLEHDVDGAAEALARWAVGCETRGATSTCAPRSAPPAVATQSRRLSEQPAPVTVDRAGRTRMLAPHDRAA